MDVPELGIDHVVSGKEGGGGRMDVPELGIDHVVSGEEGGRMDVLSWV